MKIPAVLAAMVMVVPASAALAQEPAQIIIDMIDDLTFDPERATVTAGDTVEWRNTSNLPHTATADPAEAQNPQENVALPEGAETFNSGILGPKESYRHTFTVPGEYTYFCIPHEMAGMIGHITVEPAQ